MTSCRYYCGWQATSTFLYDKPLVPFCRTGNQYMFVWQVTSIFLYDKPQVPFWTTSCLYLFVWQATSMFLYSKQPVYFCMTSSLHSATFSLSLPRWLPQYSTTLAVKLRTNRVYTTTCCILMLQYCCIFYGTDNNLLGCIIFPITCLIIDSEPYCPIYLFWPAQ